MYPSICEAGVAYVVMSFFFFYRYVLLWVWKSLECVLWRQRFFIARQLRTCRSRPFAAVFPFPCLCSAVTGWADLFKFVVDGMLVLHPAVAGV